MMRGKLCEEVRLFSLSLRRVAMLAALTARTQQEPCRDAGTGEGRARPHPPPRNQAPAHAPVRTQQTLWKGPST